MASHAGQVATLFSRSSARRHDPGDARKLMKTTRRKINLPKMNLFEDGEAARSLMPVSPASKDLWRDGLTRLLAGDFTKEYYNFIFHYNF